MKAGKTMKQAARSWKGGSKKTSTKRSTSRRRKTTPKKKKTRRRNGMRILGNVGIKGMISGGAMLFAAQSLMPMIGGDFNPAVQKIAAGLGAKAIGVSGAALAGAGAMEAGSILLRRFLQGGIPSLGGGGSNGGYML
jgi:hypothetical protein